MQNKYILLVCVMLISCCIINISPKIKLISPKRIKVSSNLQYNVKEGCVVLYEQCDFEGSSKEYCTEGENIDVKNFKNFSSILVGKKTKIILYHRSFNQRKSLRIQSNVRCFENGFTMWKNNVSSLKILQEK
jgi:hypothetical protein